MPLDSDDVRKTQALWYAWGHQDAGVKLSGDPFDFAEQYMERYAAYREERFGFMFSVQGAFEKWQNGERLMADVEEREAREGKSQPDDWRCRRLHCHVPSPSTLHPKWECRARPVVTS